MGANFYFFVSSCKSYERAKKKLKITEPPNVLTIALKRFQVIYIFNEDPVPSVFSYLFTISLHLILKGREIREAQ